MHWRGYLPIYIRSFKPKYIDTIRHAPDTTRHHQTPPDTTRHHHHLGLLIFHNLAQGVVIEEHNYWDFQLANVVALTADRDVVLLAVLDPDIRPGGYFLFSDQN